MLPRVPGIGEQTNGAFLAVKLGPIQFQPAEFAKIAIIVFLASYLRDVGDVLVRRRLRPLPPLQQVMIVVLPALGVLLIVAVLNLGAAATVLLAIFTASLVAVMRERPSLKHFGPLLLVWGVAMFMLLFIRDLGSSLMFFGGFLALLYVATGRLSLVGIGATLFFGGAIYLANNVGHVHSRIETWLHPFDPDQLERGRRQLPDRPGAVRAGRRRAVRAGVRPGLTRDTQGAGALVPAAHTDLIYAVITDEIGLFGAAGLVLVYLLFAARGFKTALIAGDGFSKLLAAGLTAVFVLQVFVIVGGVTKLIPLTGVTLPFVSYGGSSILANMVLLALLLIVSDSARRDRGRLGQGGLV